MTTNNTNNTNNTNKKDNHVNTTTVNLGEQTASIRTYVIGEPLNESFEKLLESMVEDIVIKTIAEEGMPSDSKREIESTVEEISGKLKKRIEAIMFRKFKAMRDAGPIKLFELFKARMNDISSDLDKDDDAATKPDTNTNTATESGETENE